MTLGEKIAYYRKQQRISQEQLAEKVGVSRQAVSKWEQDAALPELDNLVTLSRLFSVSTDVLLGLKEAQQADEETAGSEVRTLIRFGRKLWHNIGYFLLIWGAALIALSGCVTLIWHKASVIFIQAGFFLGSFAFICGTVLVLFRLLHKKNR
jgi:transcriptional regulator with XRE-family HTH domain